MGEKGNVLDGVAPAPGAVAAGGGGGESIVSRSVDAVVDTTTTVASDTADAVRGAAVDAVAGAAIGKASERLRRDEDEDATPDEGTSPDDPRPRS